MRKSVHPLQAEVTAMGREYDAIEELQQHPALQRLFKELSEEKQRYVLELLEIGTSHDRSNYLRGRIDSLDYVLSEMEFFKLSIESRAENTVRELVETVEKEKLEWIRQPYRRPPEGL